MRKQLLNIFMTLALFASAIAIAQVQLPYYSGFDSDAELEGWSEYRIAATEFSHWSYTQAPPRCVSHDYSPATGIGLADNWFVSPGFLIENGGTLDSIRYSFSGFSVPGENDTVGIYLLTGSQDPLLASSQQLLFDFRGEDYVNDNTLRLKTGIDLPASTELSYIAIRYRNSDNSSIWLTVCFDSVAISSKGNVGINEWPEVNVMIAPNPSSNSIEIVSSLPFNCVEIVNLIGEKGLTYCPEERLSTAELDVSDLAKGIYLVRLSNDTGTQISRIVIE